MAIIRKGDAKTALNTFRKNFKQGIGWSTTLIYNSMDYNDLLNIANDLIEDGYDIDIENSGPKYILTATLAADNESPNEVTERWTLNKEYFERSIWTLPKIMKEMDTWASNNNPRAKYRQIIEQAVMNGQNLPSEMDPMLYPLAHQIYLELSRGVENYETHYVVLSRVRSFSIGNSAAYMPFEYSYVGASKVYTYNYFLDSVISDAPQSIKNILPALPQTAPDNTVWGWKEKTNVIEYELPNKISQTHEWLFAAWSTLLYEIIGS